ncbi:MAG: GDSL-type esterase/lipase family protein [Flavitalea sp.]
MIKSFLMLSAILTITTALHAQQKLNIVFIGNSITEAGGMPNPATMAPPAQATDYIRKQKKFKAVNFSNQGVSGSTTVDFLPATNTLIKNVEKAAAIFAHQKDATLVFSMVLGTNDSAIEGPNGSPVSPESYEANVKAIIDRLFSLHPKAVFVLHHPTWYSPNTYNSSRYLQEGLTRLQSYFPVLDKIVEEYQSTHPGQVFRGDTKAFDYFKNHQEMLEPEKGNQGVFYLHPTQKGSSELGHFWGKAILEAFQK